MQVTTWGSHDNVQPWQGISRRLCTTLKNETCIETYGRLCNHYELEVAQYVCHNWVLLPSSVVRNLTVATGLNVSLALFLDPKFNPQQEMDAGAVAVAVIYSFLPFVTFLVLFSRFYRAYRARSTPHQGDGRRMGRFPTRQLIRTAVDKIERERFERRKGDLGAPAAAAAWRVFFFARLATFASCLLFPWLPCITGVWACYKLIWTSPAIASEHKLMPATFLRSQLLARRFSVRVALVISLLANPYPWLMCIMDAGIYSDRRWYLPRAYKVPTLTTVCR